VLAMIPARGGSKGFPGKNLALLGGRSLIARTVEAARESTYVDRIVVSSDVAEIIAEARAAGAEAPFVRPAKLATDEATTTSVVLHALEVLEPRPDYLVLLQPTSPLRTAADVDACIDACVKTGARACISVVETPKSPLLMYWRDGAGALQPVVPGVGDQARRQDSPLAYMLNGAVYVARVRNFLADPVFAPVGCIGVIMPRERSIDIDTKEDLIEAEKWLACRQIP
jgi:CMP-N,N'-diacetyllegionaminic acid synthase